MEICRIGEMPGLAMRNRQPRSQALPTFPGGLPAWEPFPQQRFPDGPGWFEWSGHHFPNCILQSVYFLGYKHPRVHLSCIMGEGLCGSRNWEITWVRLLQLFLQVYSDPWNCQCAFFYLVSAKPSKDPHCSRPLGVKMNEIGKAPACSLHATEEADKQAN